MIIIIQAGGKGVLGREMVGEIERDENVVRRCLLSSMSCGPVEIVHITDAMN